MSFAIDFQIDPPSINYIRSHRTESLVVDAINGTVSVKALWTRETSKSKYKPANGILTVDAVVLGPFIDELMEASLRMSNFKSGVISASLHGTPLELSIRYEDNSVTLALVEYVEYSDDQRTLGGATTSRKSFLALVTRLVEMFLSRAMLENPSLSDHPAILSFQKELEVLQKGIDIP